MQFIICFTLEITCKISHNVLYLQLYCAIRCINFIDTRASVERIYRACLVFCISRKDYFPIACLEVRIDEKEAATSMDKMNGRCLENS